MQSNITSLISTAVKKAIRRKHTLPNYKLRFKPFFNRLIFDEIDLPMEATGSLEVTVQNLARLSYPPHITQVYAMLTLSLYDMVAAQQLDDQNLITSMDIEIHKAKNQQIGIIFKQTDQVIVESIIPNTPAAVAQLKTGDVLISIEGKRITHINQVAKTLKNINKSVLQLRVERIVVGVIRNDAIVEDFADVYEDFNSVNISFSKDSESVQIGNESKTSKETAQLMDEKKSSNESSIANTPSNSPRKVLDKAKNLLRAGGDSNLNTPKKNMTMTSVCDNPHHFPQHSTIDCSISDFVRMNDSTLFHLNSSYLFLNVNVFGRSSNGQSVLLGYVNIPIDAILAECSESNLNYMEKFMLNPPETPNASTHSLSTQSGFSSSICYGDIGLDFVWNHDAGKDQPTHNSKVTVQTVQEKVEVETEVSRKHDFVRTHFNRSTHCDFCGKKIWLKDAVQCSVCSMCCHKKCMVKSQSSTVCSGTGEGKDNDDMHGSQPEFKVTTAEGDDEDYELADEAVDNYKLTGHRQSFSDLLSQGIKRVNSASNLNIPTMVTSRTQNSKSLPPTPQHTPSRKQSLITQNTNPFNIVVQKLERISEDIKLMNSEEIKSLVEPLEDWGTLDDLMELAKSSSDFLYAESDTEERLDKINVLVSANKQFIE
jgi:PDZ domain-containing protein 8